MSKENATVAVEEKGCTKKFARKQQRKLFERTEDARKAIQRLAKFCGYGEDRKLNDFVHENQKCVNQLGPLGTLMHDVSKEILKGVTLPKAD